MTIVKIGDKFAVLYTEKKFHCETIKVLRFEHDWLTIWAVCEVEYFDGTKADFKNRYAIGLIGEELRSGYMVRLN